MDSQKLPQGEEKRAAVRSMFDSIAPRYELVNQILTFGMDRGWRMRAYRSLKLDRTSLVVDLACGTGDFCSIFQKRGHKAIGIDLAFGMLSEAKTTQPLVQGDLLRIPLADSSVDAAVCGFALRNLVQLEPFFEELTRILKNGGRVALLDVSQPENWILRSGHKLYFNYLVPLVGGLLSDRQAYKYLPRSVSYLPPADTIIKLLAEAGFEQTDRRQLSGGIVQLFCAEIAKNE